MHTQNILLGYCVSKTRALSFTFYSIVIQYNINNIDIEFCSFLLLKGKVCCSMFTCVRIKVLDSN